MVSLSFKDKLVWHCKVGGVGSTGQPKGYIQFAHSFAENVQKLSAMWDRKAWLM